jgi:hypothetical protein
VKDFMAALIFVLSFLLLIAGLAGAYMSIDLVPTESGLFYAFAAAVAVVGAAVAFALGVLAARVGRLTKSLRELLDSRDIPGAVQQALAAAARPIELHDVEPALAAEAPPPEEIEAEAAADAEPLSGEARVAEIEAERAPVTEAEELTRGGDASSEPAELEEPSPHDEIQPSAEAAAPAGPPTLIGRYASAGANYMIFSDGSIEAETEDGTFKFASMGDFKQFLNDRG